MACSLERRPGGSGKSGPDPNATSEAELRLFARAHSNVAPPLDAARPECSDRRRGRALGITHRGSPLWLGVVAALACAGPKPLPASPPTHASTGVRFLEKPSPSERELYCAWYGSMRDHVLYFGQAPFWASMRAAGGDPMADLRESGPQIIGRVDLARAEWLPDLHVFGLLGEAQRSGVWDVLAADDGRVYFTTYFESAGSVDPATGDVRRFESLGPGLNELVQGPAGSILASRYGAADGSNGSVLWFTAAGALIAEHPLEGPRDVVIAAKSVAFDARRQQVWVNTDLIPRGGGPVRHDARVLDLAGREIDRIEQPEIQFMSFGSDGTHYRVERLGSRLMLRVVGPTAASAASSGGRTMMLDDAFPTGLDFVQDLQLGDDGRLVVTRWGGRIHVVTLAGGGPARAVTLDLPRRSGDALYYTATIAAGRLCATVCDGVTVACVDVP